MINPRNIKKDTKVRPEKKPSAIKETKINKIQGHPIVLTLARLEKRKGHIFVLNCIEKLKNESWSNIEKKDVKNNNQTLIFI